MSRNNDFLRRRDRQYTDNLKISVLRNAADIYPYVREITIGPKACVQNESSPINNKNVKSKTTNGDNREQISPKQLSNTATNNNSSILIDQLLHKCQLQQKETAQVMVKSMLNKMISKRSEIVTRFWHQQEMEYERNAQERRRKERDILQQVALGDKMAQLERERLDAENKAHSERMKKLLEKQLESTKMFEVMDNNHSEICKLYQEITNMVELDNKEIYVNVLQKYNQPLINLFQAIDSLAESCKSRNITANDVLQSETVKNKFVEIRDSIVSEYHTAVETALEAERVAAAAAQIANTNQSQGATSTDNTIYSYCSKKSLDIYLELQQELESHEDSYKDLMGDVSFKKFRFDCQKAVNIPVNSISSVSGSHLRDKFDKLARLLNGERVQVGDGYMSCSSHPQGKAYCMNLLAKKIVMQGEQTVSSKPEAAFPIASVVVALWAKFPQLGNLILAHFYKECPYLIPLFLPQSEGLSHEDYYKARGYRYDENGVVEKQDKFLRRMSGIFRLCAAIWVCKIPHSVKLPHPHGLCNAWRWMAAFINFDPEPDITATLLYDFLTVCGAEFFKFYKHQFVKVLQYLVNDYRKKIDKIDEGGPKVRLEVFLQNVIKDGKIPSPQGVLSDRVW